MYMSVKESMKVARVVEVSMYCLIVVLERVTRVGLLLKESIGEVCC